MKREIAREREREREYMWARKERGRERVIERWMMDRCVQYHATIACCLAAKNGSNSGSATGRVPSTQSPN